MAKGVVGSCVRGCGEFEHVGFRMIEDITVDSGVQILWIWDFGF